MARWLRTVLPALAVSLAACGGDGLAGRGYLPPSAVTATGGVPLTVPPGYGLAPGDEAATGEGAPAAPPDATPGERALLSRAGAAAADPAIRALLNRENALLAGGDPLVEELLFGDLPPDDGEAVAIEALDGEAGWLDDAWESLGH